MNRKPLYFPNLDGLRFFGFLLIFCSHALFSISFSGHDKPAFSTDTSLTHLGFAGLDFFFVLSSFLITFTILGEYETSGGFSFKNYFIRRSLRIWPLYFLIVVAGFVLVSLAPLFEISVSPLPSPVWFLSFTLNFYVMEDGQNFLFFMVFLWTLSVEEQFYLAWGLWLRFFKKYALHFCFLLIFTSLFFRYYLGPDHPGLLFHTLGIVSNFALGGILAWSCVFENEFFNLLKSLRRSTVFLLYALLAILLFTYNPIFGFGKAYVFERLVFGLLFTFVIFDQCYGENRLFNAGALKPIRFLGKISYGLYVFHGIAITLLHFSFFKDFLGNSPVEIYVVRPLILLTLTILFSTLSYFGFEKFFLNISARFRKT